ncbi:hypothetical protein acsn021_38420 [Anaerocolumna cellulosilytica]|uniref:Uncharacterized protein n=1 Tax=Anaerocolumna cellulosilytica TaxID=433286 RepID=A0A6S6QYH4_9FIRM|nr:hypothetical protein [Anaerocolumna cellulosilytica]MBB5196244.1 rRNA maturation endonuclease Nob1 [Anaerocolumna cellulosilytica]BCJ96273.1 hypothetical protein acsn021_38420 [Anaerocolumna cellulosilytica]
MSIFKKLIHSKKPERIPPLEKKEDIRKPLGTDEEYEIVEVEILPEKMICPDCGGITLAGLDFCDKCGGELIVRD